MPRFTPIVEIAPGATVTGNPNTFSWTDLTAQRYVHEPSGITIRRGRQDRYSEAQPDTCGLVLLNNAGVFVPRNPLSPLYGRIARGTPLRVSMRPSTNSASDTFSRTTVSSWGTADSGGSWTNVGSLPDYSVSPASGGRHTNNAAAVQHYSTLPFSLVRVDLKVRVRVNALSTGAAQQAGLTLRYVDASNNKRAEILFNVGGTMTLRIVSRSAGTDTALASTTLSLSHGVTSWYWLRIQTGYNSSRTKVWLDATNEPATWDLDSSVGSMTTTAGAVGCFSQRATGNTNAAATTDFDNFSMLDGPRIIFTGFVEQWPLRWNDQGMEQAFAPITASGQLQRLGRAKTLRSPIYRSTAALSSLVAYWPMEDGSTAPSFASALSGGPTGHFASLTPASDSQVVGSDPLPSFSQAVSRIWFNVPAYSSTSWAISWVMKIPAASLSGGGAQVMSWITPGSSIVRWLVTLTPGTPDTVRLDAITSGSGTVTGSTAALTDATSGAELTDGRQLQFVVTGTQNGGNVDTNLVVYYVADADGQSESTFTADSFAGTTGPVSYIYHDAISGFAGHGHTIGHVALGSTTSAYIAGSTAVSGGAGDTTSTRFQSLVSSEGITPLVGDLVRGFTTTTQQMGPMRSGDIMSQLREVEATEAGVMHDSKEGFLELLPRSYRYNRTVDLTLDMASGQVGSFDPTEDDYLLRNTVTVTNAGGSSAVAQDATSIATSGVYPDSVTVNVWQGADLDQHASWRLISGTTGAGLRYPSIVLDLTRTSAALASAWFDTDIGSRIKVTNVASGELPPEDLDLILDGYTEIITSSTWRATLNCSPGSQWLAAVLDSSTPRLDCGASTVAAVLGVGATSMQVAWADACNWTHARGDFDILVSGERMTVTDVNSAVRDTFTRPASSGWGTSDSGHAWTVGAGTASLFSATGSVGQIAVSAVNSEHHIALDLGSASYQRVRVYQTLGVTPTGAGINWGVVLRRTDAANLFWIDVQVGTDSSLTIRIISKIAGANTQLASQLSSTTHSTSVARILIAEIDANNVIRAKVYPSTALVEPPWEITYDASAVTTLTSGTGVGCISRLMTGNTNAGPVNFAFDNFSILNPQAMTVTRAVNGIVKPQVVGSEVHVANPIIVSL